MKNCPYDGIAYSEVPGYIEGYGCPICKGISAKHVQVEEPVLIEDHGVNAFVKTLWESFGGQRGLAGYILREIADGHNLIGCKGDLSSPFEQGIRFGVKASNSRYIVKATTPDYWYNLYFLTDKLPFDCQRLVKLSEDAMVVQKAKTRFGKDQ